MKTRATSRWLAALAVVSLVLPALAADTGDFPEEMPVESMEIVEPEEVHNAVLLDGERAESVEFEIRDNVCYVTVGSFVSMMDAEAMVEEEAGVVNVSASAVAEVVPLSGEAGSAESTVYADSMAVDPDLTPDGELEEAVDADYTTANVVMDDLDLTAAAGEFYLVANGRYLYTQDGLSQINGRVAAPVRLLARVYNLDVAYNEEDELVLLSHREGEDPYLADGSMVYDGDTLYWLSRIINAESGNQSLEGKIAVGNVVMNRVNNPRFPDNIYDVLFQKNQFSPVVSGTIYREPNWESMAAAMMVLDGAQVTPTALFFNGAGLRSYASRTRTYVTTIGSHAFYE